MATLEDLEFRVAGMETQVAVLAKEIRDLVTSFRGYMDQVQQGAKFMSGILRNENALGTFKRVMADKLPEICPSVVADPTSAFCGGGVPPVGALSPGEIEALLHEHGASER